VNLTVEIFFVAVGKLFDKAVDGRFFDPGIGFRYHSVEVRLHVDDYLITELSVC